MGAVKKKVAKLKTTTLYLTAKDLEMMRDVIGAIMPVLIASGEDKGGISEACIAEYIAVVSGRVKLEHALWKKIAKACAQLGVATGKAAPTFAVSSAQVPALHVYRIEDD